MIGAIAGGTAALVAAGIAALMRYHGRTITAVVRIGGAKHGKKNGI